MSSFYHLIFDIKYLTKPEALKYILNETDFVESLISHLPKLYFLDAIEQRTEHIGYDLSIFKDKLYDLEI